MRLSASKLRAKISETGVSLDDLAARIAREGFSEKAARSALSNWTKGRDHPRARLADIAAVARAMGAAPKDIARWTSLARFTRSSPRKSRLLADMIRGRSAEEALTALRFNKRRAAMMVDKALRSAIADAEHADADIDRLVVAESRVDGGPIIKRFQPKDRGRAHPIQKRTSHIVVGVEETA